ncbi:autotransporter assembly complex protein TamA [Nitrosophilus kaiyonis]|uniref:autotransporter assembly complex protein TamA n=1 Tax=Nitrosophilus kaiyonis TaxID=2930200 RepID=UPI002491D2D5|nr:POTRA domain-containing protein [Nitrosophilus kaiyonis]
MRFLIIFIFSLTLFAAKYSIDFKGNKTFDKNTLYKELGFEKTFWQILTFKKLKPKVDEKILPSLKEELELFYKQEGYWHSKITLKKDKKLKKAIFIIDENRPVIIKKIEITSNFPIEKYIELKENAKFNTKKFIQTKENIKKALLKKGYCSYEFDPKSYLYLQKNEAYVVFYVNKGEICKIKKINITGNKSIKDDVILSHIYFKKGDNFSLEKIEESYKRLYALEYFRSVNIDYSKKINNNILSEIKVKERKKRNIYKTGIGYESKNGFHINFSWKNINISQKQIKIDTIYSNNKKEISTKFFIPSVKILSNSYDIVNKILINEEKFDYFSQKVKQIGINFIKEYYKLSYSLGLFLENSKIFDTSSCYNDGTYKMIYPTFTFILDNKDSKISPKNGFIIKSNFEGSLETFSDITYIKNLNEAGIYFDFDKFSLFLKGKIGIIDSNKDLNPSKLFYAGGINSNRAYSYNSLYATDSKCKSGGYSILETSIELSYPVYKKILGIIFWDRTVLSVKKYSFFNKPINGIGFGAKYPTKIGDLRFYMGFDAKDFRKNALNIAIGATF